MRLILASNSPRRKELLEQGGYKFSITCSDFVEISAEKDPEKISVNFAGGKAKDVFDKQIDKENVVVIGADTVVFIDGEILGKPQDKSHAVATLKKLSGRTHTVVTGYSIITNNLTISNFVSSFVTFNDLSEQLIDNYVNSGLCMGKAGAYGIQDGFPLVKEYKGSYTNIIGLPTETVFPILDKLINNND